MKKNKKVSLLIVDDEPAARYGMRKALTDKDYDIREAENGKEAVNILNVTQVDIVLSDIYMPEMDGLELVRHVQAIDKNVRPLIIVLTAFGSEKLAVEAMKAGAYDYLSKPFNIDELRLTVIKAVEKLELKRENRLLKMQLERESRQTILGKSPQIAHIHKLVDKVAPADITVLLTGESGTGKELVARTIHNTSSRKDGPFVTMNCAAIPRDLVESELFGHEKGAFTGAVSQREGKFETANKGTLFLDEIADMDLETQAKILRVLEEKSFTRLGGAKPIHTDVRLISATNKDLQQEIAAERFREDLYYRLKVLEIRLPSLRQRTMDIPILTEHFLGMFTEKYDKDFKNVDSAAMQKLLQYAWPGNVRQLMHVIEQCVVLMDGDTLTVDFLPPELASPADPAPENIDFEDSGLSFTEAKEQMVTQFETRMIIRALQESRGNVSEAARALKMKRQFLQQKMKTLGLTAADYK